MTINRRSFLAGGTLSVTGLSSSAGARESPLAGVKKARVVSRLIKENGPFPNSRLPLLVYQAALELPTDDPASAIEALIHKNGWGNDWRDGIFTYHHYHSTAHECLLVYRGTAKVQLGGDGGIIESIAAGDVVIIPAGVAHKNVGASSDLQIVGAYPPHQEVDMNYGKPEERPRADQNIARLPLPTTDPVYGKSGPLLELWRPQS